MNRRLTTVVNSLLAACVLLLALLLCTPVLGVGSYPLGSSDTEVAAALDYLRGEQDTEGSIGGFSSSAWVVMAIAAAGENPHSWQNNGTSIVDYLATNASSANSATDYARMLLAIAAADEDPTSFGGRNFVSLLEATYDGTQIGDDTLLNDDFWGVMGLIAAGQSSSSSIIADSVNFILTNQGTDGGWSWGVGGDSDVDDTAAAIMALISAGESPGSTAIIDALAYIKSTQMDNGGFESWGSTNAESNSWGITGIVAAGQDPNGAEWASGTGNTPVDDLLTFQQVDGSFYWQISSPGMSVPKTTACAITALLGIPFPVAILTPQEGDTIDVRVEGQSQTIWSGSVTVAESSITATSSGITYHFESATALGALDEASRSGGFPYETTDEYGPLFVTSINNEEPEGMGGWMYRVDYYSPEVGAADFILDETTPPSPPHGEVLFYYGEWGQPPLKIEVSQTEVDVGEQFTTTVTQYSDDTHTWSPCENATVIADQSYLTGADGTVAITIDLDMTIDIYAEKDGFIRSNQIAVTVGTGTGAAQEVELVAKIVPAINFTVDPGSINFGQLGPRDTSAPYGITITNLGTWDIVVTCTVTDNADDLYVTGLKLDDKIWSLFEKVILENQFATCQATLTVPEYYSRIGEQTGTLIFWASEAP